MKSHASSVKYFNNFVDADAHLPPPPSMPRIAAIAKAAIIAVVMVMASPTLPNANRHIRAHVATIRRIRIRRICRIRCDITARHGTQDSEAKQNQPYTFHGVPDEF